MFAGIILAAGCSRRMGCFKPLLPLPNITADYRNPTTFIRNIVDNMLKADVRKIVVVTGFRSEELIAHLNEYPVEFVFNPEYATSDMFSSVKIGLKACLTSPDASPDSSPDASPDVSPDVSSESALSGIFIAPVDIPLPDFKIYTQLMEDTAIADIKRPSFNNRSGHPILLNRQCLNTILNYSGSGGLKTAISSNHLIVRDIKTDIDVILYDTDTPEDYIRMSHPISKPITRIDHHEKITASAKYVSDYSTAADGSEILVGHLLRSTNAHANIKSVNVPELPEGYFFIGPEDVPYNVAFYPSNDLPASMSQEDKDKLLSCNPVFADKVTEYYGQPLGMIVGPKDSKVRELLREVTVEYEPLEAVVYLKDAKEEFISFDRNVGDYQTAFEEADEIYEEDFDTGYQYQAPLETQALMAEFDADGRLHLHGSMQCPFVVRHSIAIALKVSDEDIHVSQDATGGAFGGKEDFPSYLAPQVAVAAMKTHRCVRVVFDRNEDIQFASKRHPFHARVRLALKDGHVTGVETYATMNAGAAITSSCDVAMVFFAKFPNVYSFDTLHVNLRVMKTNTPPCGAFRGFGNPQAAFAIDMAMSHLASHLGRNELEFKNEYFATDDKPTPTGGKYHFHVPLQEMLDMAKIATDFDAKHALYSQKQTGRFRRGIGIGFANQGSTFGGSAEWAGIKASPKIFKHSDGTVTIETAHCEIGQGIRTAFAKIAAEELGISTDLITVNYPDTDRANDTGPSAGSRGVMVVGAMVREAARKLKENWIDGEEQLFTATFKKPPFLGPFDEEKQFGDSFPDYLWAITVLEVMVDTITGRAKILDAYGVYNVGTPIDINILRGQMEGGLLQGIGYAAYERLVFGPQGKIFNTAFADYHIPTFKDVEKLRVDFQYEEYSYGPFGAKGCGEIPIAGPGVAFLTALEQALGSDGDIKLNHIPFVAEDIADVINKEC